VRSSNLDKRLRALLQSSGNSSLKVARPIGWSLFMASILIALGLACVEMTHAISRPLVQNGPASGEKVQSSPKKKSRIFAMANLKVKRAGQENEENFSGVIAIDPETGKWQKITGSGFSGRVSPDGETLAFGKFNAGNDTSIWNCDTHGTDNPGKIADFGSLPIWSPDGKYLVTNKGPIGQHEAWQMEADGSKAKKLPIPKTDEVDDWSSDGKWFVTVSDRHPPHGHGYQLYVMHPDGTNERRLTKNGLNCYPRFSPDSRKIVYIHQTHKEGNSIRMVDIDGKNDREILREEGLVYPDFACWSPHGKRLAIVRREWEGIDEKGNRFGSGKLEQHLEIMDADGQNRRVLELADAKIFWLGHADWKEIRMRD
jgi:Tol biopolymer transport system component